MTLCNTPLWAWAPFLQIKASKFVRSDGAHSRARLAKLVPGPFFGEGAALCPNVQDFNGGDFVYSHQRPADYGALPLAAATSDRLADPAVQAWVDRLLRQPAGTIVRRSCCVCSLWLCCPGSLPPNRPLL